MHVAIMIQMSWAVSTRMAMMTWDAGKETSAAPAKLSWFDSGSAGRFWSGRETYFSPSDDHSADMIIIRRIGAEQHVLVNLVVTRMQVGGLGLAIQGLLLKAKGP
jgi:hypothetical protein